MSLKKLQFDIFILSVRTTSTITCIQTLGLPVGLNSASVAAQGVSW